MVLHAIYLVNRILLNSAQLVEIAQVAKGCREWTHAVSKGAIPGGLYSFCNANADAGSEPVGKSIAEQPNINSIKFLMEKEDPSQCREKPHCHVDYFIKPWNKQLTLCSNIWSAWTQIKGNNLEYLEGNFIKQVEDSAIEIEKLWCSLLFWWRTLKQNTTHYLITWRAWSYVCLSTKLLTIVRICDRFNAYS